jgi:PAS domain S-box-containing protein
MVKNKICQFIASYISFAENIPAQVFVFSEDCRFIYVNPCFCQFVGLNKEELIGKQAHECIFTHNSNTVKSFLQGLECHEQVIKSGKTLVFEETLINSKNREVYFKVLHSPVFDENGNIIGTQGIRIDITGKMEKEEKVCWSKLRNDEKETYYKNFKHEINTSIHAILGFSDMIKSYGAYGDERDTYVNIIFDNTFKLVRCIDNLLNILSRNLVKDLIKEPINVYEVCYNIFNMFETRPQIDQGFKILFKPQKSQEQDVYIFSDQFKFIYMISAMLSQMLRLSSKGTILFGYTIELKKIKIFIFNATLFLSPEILKNLLYPTEIDNLSSSEDFDICKTYATQLGTNIRIQSDPKEGTCFYIIFPIE